MGGEGELWSYYELPAEYIHAEYSHAERWLGWSNTEDSCARLEVGWDLAEERH